ncbi:MAG: metallophosphoesterase [Chloroflexia bacterium]|nr:metallophosphoesterase [Chloroflexia bacterium]
MKIAVISDVHDHLQELGRALDQVQGCKALLCCGDLCAPFSLRAMAEGFPGEIHVVSGNNDGDPLLLSRVAQQYDQVILHGVYAEIELDGQRIALVHYPRLAEGLAATADYDLVCHGHDHQARQARVGRTLLLNPGEVMGWKGRSSCAIYDTTTRSAEIIDL